MLLPLQIPIANQLFNIVIGQMRAFDTRGGPGVPIGGPALEAQIPRVFALGGHCNIPSTAKAVSAIKE